MLEPDTEWHLENRGHTLILTLLLVSLLPPSTIETKSHHSNLLLFSLLTITTPLLSYNHSSIPSAPFAMLSDKQRPVRHAFVSASSIHRSKIMLLNMNPRQSHKHALEINFPIIANNEHRSF